MRLIFNAFILLLFSGNSPLFAQTNGLIGVDELDKIPKAPDYTQMTYWIAHPDKEDQADLVPGRNKLTNQQAEAKADVFFIYPTIYTGEQDPSHPWYADVNDAAHVEKVATSTIQYQASVFNGSARVYSPLYRQVHIRAFFSDSTLMNTTLDFAYQDVKEAFEYYLANWHQDRPIIIASHSQGTVHAARLLQEYFEGKALNDKLIAAYIVGMPVQKDHFDKLPLCASPDQTGCWLTWNTFRDGFYNRNHEKVYKSAASVNPLTWTTDTTLASRRANIGGVLKNYNRLIPRLTDARNHEGMLWIHKPHFFGNIFINWDRYHVVDYNLFYLNIRQNVETRVNSYLLQRKTD